MPRIDEKVTITNTQEKNSPINQAFMTPCKQICTDVTEWKHVDKTTSSFPKPDLPPSLI